jgi:hypothetical protein
MERFEKIIKLIAELIMPKYVFERSEMGKKNRRHNSNVDFYGNMESDVPCLERSLN